MFLLCQHGEGNRTYEAELAALFQQTIHATLDRKNAAEPCTVCTHPGCAVAPCGSTAFCSDHYPCAFKKVNKSTEKTCNKFGVFGTCYCDEHYPDVRKELIRAFFKREHMFIPATTELHGDFQELTDRSWDTFNQVLTRADGSSALNTLSLIVWLEHPAERLDLSEITRAFKQAGDYLGADDAASFVNVIEFVAVFQNDDGTDLHNASVKLWSNNQIQVSGCKSVTSALKVTSAVIRTLIRARLVDASAKITTVKPVFANASFEFFDRGVTIGRMQTRAFLEQVEHELDGTSVRVELGAQRDLFVQFQFTRGTSKTTVKIYPKGNVIITFNNFDGLLLQQGLQGISKCAEKCRVFSDDRLSIRIDPPEVFKSATPQNTFLFSPMIKRRKI
jgi:hypothetical protein